MSAFEEREPVPCVPVAWFHSLVTMKLKVEGRDAVGGVCARAESELVADEIAQSFFFSFHRRSH
jgi:hypothetical protein